MGKLVGRHGRVGGLAGTAHRAAEKRKRLRPEWEPRRAHSGQAQGPRRWRRSRPRRRHPKNPGCAAMLHTKHPVEGLGGLVLAALQLGTSAMSPPLPERCSSRSPQLPSARGGRGQSLWRVGGLPSDAGGLLMAWRERRSQHGLPTTPATSLAPSPRPPPRPPPASAAASALDSSSRASSAAPRALVR